MNLKEKFENYTLPVDESGWESIANDPALVRYNRGRLIRRICGYGIPALVVTAVVATALFILGAQHRAMPKDPAITPAAVSTPTAPTSTEVAVPAAVTAPAPSTATIPATAAPVTESTPNSKAAGASDAHVVPAPQVATVPVSTASNPTPATSPVAATTPLPKSVATPKSTSPVATHPATPVTVTVPDEAKNAESDTPEEPVSEYEFYIPNAFTPNGDGINDLLYFKANFEPRTFEVAIYNRRGEQVFHTRTMEIGWDGNFQGRELPGEVYTYVIKYTDPDNKVLSRRGQVIIIR